MKSNKNVGKRAIWEDFLKGKGNFGEKWKERGTGAAGGKIERGTNVFVARTNVTKVTEKAEDMLHIYSGYCIDGGAWESPLFKLRKL